LFEGLAIERLETEWEQYPVLHLDLNAENYSKTEALDLILNCYLNLWESCFGTDDRKSSLSTRFSGIIRRAYEKTGKRVVVLIDEYDKPLLETLRNETLNESYRDTLTAFYGVLKSSERHV
jgi:hypothetical protein